MSVGTMEQALNAGAHADFSAQRPICVGAVSYLNTLPLIEGLSKLEGLSLALAAPSLLLPMLERGDVDLALMPIVDQQQAEVDLAMAPAGMIASDGPTLTVRLFSKTPIEQLTQVHADTDSHTSVVLLQVLLRELHDASPQIVSFDARERIATSGGATGATAMEWPEAFLMIGDKVTRDSPPAVRYPHQMDLGDAWRKLTGAPFVYAMWMCRAADMETPNLGVALRLLDRQRRHNLRRLDWIAAAHARAHGWPTDLASDYLGRMLQFEPSPAHKQAIELFFAKAHEHGLLSPRPILWADAWRG